MLSEEQEQSLVSLCNQFITSGEGVGLAHLIDLINSMIPNLVESVVANKHDERMGKPGDWSVDSFLCGM
jgi:hypothetical protein